MNATVVFEGLAAAIKKPSKSLHRMLASRAKPNAQAALLINLVKRYPDTVRRLATL